MPKTYEVGEISKKRKRQKFNKRNVTVYTGDEVQWGISKEAHELIASSICSFEELEKILKQQSSETLSRAKIDPENLAVPGAVTENTRPRFTRNVVARSIISNKIGVEHNSEGGFAVEILHRLRGLAARLGEGRQSLALLEAFQLGMAERERQTQEWTDAGWGVRTGGKKGHDLAYPGTPEDHARMERDFDDLRAKGMKITAAYRAIADLEDINWESVGRIIRKRKKRHTS